jgi:hypothetical protein
MRWAEMAAGPTREWAAWLGAWWAGHALAGRAREAA